ncbi:hypothetical protein GGR55DRAFT_692564 [Xylaria sp. FL0064]|nr:hypothetical protein GGR55DRAFT_692564 [Xylaria sp. FL0064]
MPPKGSSRNWLQSDIQAAAGPEVVIPHVRIIGKGDAQDEFIFAFVHPEVPRGEIKIHVMPEDTAGYPDDAYYVVYTNDEVSSNIRVVLDNAMTSTRGLRIIDLLRSLSRLLCDTLGSTDTYDEGDDHNVIMTDVDDDNEGDGDDNADSFEVSDDDDTDVPFDYDDGEDDFGFDDRHLGTGRRTIHDAVLQRIRQDFRAVRNAGFKVGKIYGIDQPAEYGIMAMSVKASKLCLSEETHNAWNLEPSDYLVLLMKFTGEYVSFEDALARPTSQIPLEFRLRRCSKYRPTLNQAIAAFSPLHGKNRPEISAQKSDNYHNSLAAGDGFLTFGVGGSIDLLLKNDFLSMMKLRKRYKVSWDEAKRIQSQLNKSATWDNEPMEVSNPKANSANIIDTNLPPILRDDHLSSNGPISLPLIAMRFSLRYLVKCTEYCMICHEKTAGNFEALKPYVCGNPLCLFQYMSLGLGPSIDHEIINQEYVVDLLISFCYASLYNWKKPQLREFPSGLDLKVPCVRPPGYTSSDLVKQIKNYGTLIDPREIEISWPNGQAKIMQETRANDPALTVGCWVVVHTHHSEDVNVFHYARIEEKCGSIIQLHVASRFQVPMKQRVDDVIQAWDWNKIDCTSGQLVLCAQPLDELQTYEEKAFLLILLLSTLPSVAEMRSYLMADQYRQLSRWNRIPSESMKLLRWIIASNRSFIVQLENPPEANAKSSGVKVNSPDRAREKIEGIDGWIQFRFAQGSPEKEALFLNALQEVENPYRTILAWHGSPVGNWHSIIREGLNFNVTANGRAYGDGVYFSRSFDYSLGYSGANRFIGLYNGRLDEESYWPQSVLKITSAISLNELVNRPDKFRHTTHCYVVDVLHWIQCRYLFVRAVDHQTIPPSKRRISFNQGEVFAQDPQHTITGPQNKTLVVPKIAIPLGQQWQQHGTSYGEGHSNDTSDEEGEDIDFLAFEEDVQSHTTKAKSNTNDKFPPTPTNQELLTDFRPGSLDFSKLPKLAPTSYATRSAQQVIQRELQKLEKIQTETPIHELGWYIDFEKIDNMFEWIVEMHSFDPKLLLAQDMKAAGITSIVIGIRFLRGFPVTPPFVRVIRPRFLPFSMGGGGHVTSGGALCMELLTNTGWSPVSSMESVLLQVRLAMCGREPKPARLEKRINGDNQYSYAEAVDAAIRAHTSHGWEVPVELKETLQA